LLLNKLVNSTSTGLHSLEAANHIYELKVGASLLTLEFLPIFIYIVIIRAFVHQVNGLVPHNVFLVPILNVDLGQVLTVVTLGLREHPALLIVLKLLLKSLCVLIKANVSSSLWVILREESNSISFANYPSDTFTVILIFLLLIVIISRSPLQEIPLLLLREARKVYVQSRVLVIVIIGLLASLSLVILHVTIYNGDE
jgi:hypothetical protein